MKYKELLKEAIDKFEVDEKIVLYLIKYYLKLSDEDMIKNIELNKKIVNSFFEKITLYKKGIPIQYIVGNVNFYGYNFEVAPGVLIPRFETEQLVYHTKNYIKKYFEEDISLIDIGTGSGVIGLSLKKEIPDISVTLVDISDIALSVSMRNAENLDVKATIFKSDMLDEVIKQPFKYDVLISNPPYLTKDEEIMEIVKINEPSIALYGGEKGLKYYEIILSKAKNIIKDRALIAFEIGANQASEIIDIANKYFYGCKYEIKKDFEGRERMFFLFYNLSV